MQSSSSTAASASVSRPSTVDVSRNQQGGQILGGAASKHKDVKARPKPNTNNSNAHDRIECKDDQPVGHVVVKRVVGSGRVDDVNTAREWKVDMMEGKDGQFYAVAADLAAPMQCSRKHLVQTLSMASGNVYIMRVFRVRSVQPNTLVISANGVAFLCKLFGADKGKSSLRRNADMIYETFFPEKTTCPTVALIVFACGVFCLCVFYLRRVFVSVRRGAF